MEVTAAPPGVELAKSTPTLSRSFDAQLIESMPLIVTREVTRLALFTPTVRTDYRRIDVFVQRAAPPQ